MRLAGIDLNLLVVLDAVLSEPTVTLAAKRLGMSQSATSHALARLRDLLGDPILVRTRGGMAPTPRALALAAPVRALLEEAERAIRPPVFDPATHRGSFTVGLDDATQAGMLPAVVGRLRELSPGIDLRASTEPPASLPELLERGQLDLAVTAIPEAPRGLRTEPLLRARYVGIARRGHPGIGKRMTLPRFVALGHVAVETRGSVDLALDAWLAECGLARRVVVATSSPLAVPAIVAGSDLVASVPERLLPLVERQLRLARFALPVPLEPVTISLLWHERTEHDPARRFLRELFRALHGGRRAA